MTISDWRKVFPKFFFFLKKVQTGKHSLDVDGLRWRRYSGGRRLTFLLDFVIDVVDVDRVVRPDVHGGIWKSEEIA